MKIVIIGAGTGAINIANIIIKDKNFRLTGFIGTAEEEEKFGGKKLLGDIPFLGDHSLIPKLRENDIVGFVVAISDNSLREKAFYEATKASLTPINIISPSAVIEPSAIIGKGVVISAGCIISHGVKIRDNTYLGTGVIVEINTKINENCVLTSACVIGGECDIGRNVRLDMRSTLVPYVKVGKNQLIEAGSVIKQTLPDLNRNEF